jgi:hypothetical protein
MKNYKLLFYAVFVTYLVWGSFWLGMCQYPIAEECISGRWYLFYTGLPSTIISLGFGGVGIPELILTAVIGGVQWAGLTVLFMYFYNRKLASKQ